MVRPFDAHIRDLHGFDSRGSRILSLYLRTSPAAGSPPALVEQMQGVVRGLRDELGDTDRAALDSAIEMARDYVCSMVAPPAAIAIFASASRGYFRVVRLPVEVTPAAHWSALPETGPLRRLAERRQEMQYSSGRPALSP